jgi:hypothetical protein
LGKYRSLWSLDTGAISSSVRRDGQSGLYTYTLPPNGSVVIVISDTAISEGTPLIEGRRRPVAATVKGSETTVKRLEPNVLTLDFVDVKVGSEERKDVYTWQANRWIFQKHGFGAGNPWDNQVQFKDELITKKFPADSGFEATYRFTVEGNVPNDFAAIVIERPDLYKIFVNTEPVAVQPDAWWLDRAFGKVDLSKIAKPGENVVKIVAQPMTIEHEIEPAYLLGNFSLRSADKGFIVCPPQPLTMKAAEVPLQERHSDEPERVSWLSAGIGFRANRPDLQDRSPSLTFEFAEEQQIAAIKIWNYCERTLQKRGVKAVEITGLGKVELPLGNGSATDIPFATPKRLKTIEFKILSNHAGTTYPIPNNVTPDDNGFVGLAEVQFLVKDKDDPSKLVPVKNVTVKASSELVADSHDRRAQYLVDGSGLGRGVNEQGWHRQGMPFYAGKVEYSRSFDVAKVAGTYSVKLPSSPGGWYGAAARIFVNGNDAGFVVGAPWSVDVTKFVKQGRNDISVQVYGTPKNLLGPHHAGRQRGSAWPGMFHPAPEHQPPGSAYDVIGYGLFEPFEFSVVR